VHATALLFERPGEGLGVQLLIEGRTNRDLCAQVMVLSQDRDRGRVTLSTKKLEPTPGDMLKNPQAVFENADQMAETFRKRVEAAEMSARADPSPMAAAMDPAAVSPYSSVDYPQGDFNY